MKKQSYDNLQTMNWITLISDLSAAGMSQTAIGSALGKSQAWVCALAAGQYADIKWSDGEALRRLHAEKLGAGDTTATDCPVTKEAA